jgi:hypothetical protein
MDRSSPGKKLADSDYRAPLIQGKTPTTTVEESRTAGGAGDRPLHPPSHMLEVHGTRNE